MKRNIERWLLGLLLFLVLTPIATAQTTAPAPAPSQAQLDEALRFFCVTPAAQRSESPRRHHMATIQQAANQLDNRDYYKYAQAWAEDPATADRMEQQGVLWFLRQATLAAMDDIRRTRVQHGVVIWHLYNMGFVVKTPDACFGLDVHCRDAARLAQDLDFLLVTHVHGDHANKPLIEAMLQAGKPVVTNFHPQSTLIAPATQPASAPTTVPTTLPAQELQFGSVQVRVEVGDHHLDRPDSVNNMLMYQVDCGPDAGHFTIYHTGDAANRWKMHPSKPIDAFIVHVQVGMPVEKAIAVVQPKRTFVSHVLELAHSTQKPHDWRWAYEYAYRQVANTPPEQIIVPVWGERWEFNTAAQNR